MGFEVESDGEGNEKPGCRLLFPEVLPKAIGLDGGLTPMNMEGIEGRPPGAALRCLDGISMVCMSCGFCGFEVGGDKSLGRIAAGRVV